MEFETPKRFENTKLTITVGKMFYDPDIIITSKDTGYENYLLPALLKPMLTREIHRLSDAWHRIYIYFRVCNLPDNIVNIDSIDDYDTDITNKIDTCGKEWNDMTETEHTAAWMTAQKQVLFTDIPLYYRGYAFEITSNKDNTGYDLTAELDHSVGMASSENEPNNNIDLRNITDKEVLNRIIQQINLISRMPENIA